MFFDFKVFCSYFHYKHVVLGQIWKIFIFSLISCFNKTFQGNIFSFIFNIKYCRILFIKRNIIDHRKWYILNFLLNANIYCLQALFLFLLFIQFGKIFIHWIDLKRHLFKLLANFLSKCLAKYIHWKESFWCEILNPYFNLLIICSERFQKNFSKWENLLNFIFF